MTKRAALILAGGKAQRFQTPTQVWQDKALAMLEGKPLLVHAVENVQGVVDEVIVCVNDEDRKAGYREILERYGLAAQIVVDEKTEICGPSVAIMSGLGKTQADYCLTIPCDMPFLEPKVADYLLTQAAGFEVTVPMWPNGRLETLNMILHRQAALEIVQTLAQLKRARSDDIIRASAKTLLVSPLNEIKVLDPELKSFININSKEDLTKPQTRQTQGPVKENVQLSTRVRTVPDLKLLRDGAQLLQQDDYSGAERTFDLGRVSFEVDGGFFWSAVAAEFKAQALLKIAAQDKHEPEVEAKLDVLAKGALSVAAKSYQCEAAIYEKNRCSFLVERASADKVWCEAQAAGTQVEVSRYKSKAT
jgi:molybdopterin-guanine dinucleotide biosynthesis protein A